MESYGSDVSIESTTPTRTFTIPRRFVTVVVVSVIQIVISLSDNIIFATISLEIERRDQELNNISEILNVTLCNISITSSFGKIKSIGAEVCTGWTQDNFDIYDGINTGGCVLANVVSGYISDKYGGRYPLLVALAFRSILNFVTPIVMNSTNCNFYATCMVMVLYGCGQGVFVPSITTIVAHWVPPKERSLVAGLTLMSEYVGYSLHVLLGEKMILAQTDYRNLFYIMGAVTVIATALWWYVGNSSALECKVMSSTEDLFLKRELAPVVSSGVKRVPIMRMILSINVWALVIGACSPIWINRMGGYLIEMYLKDVRGKNLAKEPLWWSMKIVTAIIMVSVFGFLSDFFINRGLILNVTLRKFFTDICTTGTVIFLIGGANSPCQFAVASVQFMIAMCVLSSFGIGVNLVPLDLAPNFAGTLAGVCYGFAFASYFIINCFFYQSLDSFNECRKAIWFTFLASLIGNSVFVLLGDTKIQNWNFANKVAKAHHLKKFG